MYGKKWNGFGFVLGGYLPRQDRLFPYRMTGPVHDTDRVGDRETFERRSVGKI